MAKIYNLEFYRWQKTHLGVQLTSAYTTAKIRYYKIPLTKRLKKVS